MRSARALEHLATVARFAVAPVIGAGMLAGAVAVAPHAAPSPVVTDRAGLASAHWQVETPTETKEELRLLLARESAASGSLPAIAASSTAAVATQPGVLGGVSPAGPGAGASGEQLAVVLSFALQQRGKPYEWGATGPARYDCSGLTLRSYEQAGVVLPRTAASQAQVGTPVRLSDLVPGDLVFWAYDPADPSTVHHVAIYLGGGLVVHAPQTGDVVRVAPLWLTGYAGAVRLITSGPGGVPAPGVAPEPGSTPAPSVPATPGPSATATPAPTTSPASTAPATTPVATPAVTGTPASTPSGSATPPASTAPAATTAPAPTTTPPAATDPAPSADAPASPPATAPTTAPATPAPASPPPTTPPATTTSQSTTTAATATTASASVSVSASVSASAGAATS